MEILLYLSGPILVTGVLFAVLTVIAIILRLATKRLTGNRFGLDDLFLLMAAGFFYIENIIQLHCLRLASMVESLEDPLFVKYMRLIWISATLAVPTLSCLKLSVLFFYRPIFGNVKWFRMAVNALVVMVVLYCICGTAGEICESTDPGMVYDAGVDPNGKCMDMETYGRWILAHVIVDTILDATILMLPLSIVCRLQLPTWKKVAVSAIFALGSFTVATNIIRLTIMFGNKNTDKIGMINELWIVIHCGCGIICCCLPLYGPLITRLINSVGRISAALRPRKPRIRGQSLAVPVDILEDWAHHQARVNTNAQKPEIRIENVENIQLCHVCHNNAYCAMEVPKKPSADPLYQPAERTVDLI